MKCLDNSLPVLYEGFMLCSKVYDQIRGEGTTFNHVDPDSPIADYTKCVYVHVINIHVHRKKQAFSRIRSTVQAPCNSQRRAIGICFSGPICAQQQ